MTIDWTKPVQTRDGRKMRVLCTDAKNSSHPVIVLIEGAAGEELFYYDRNGIRRGGIGVPNTDAINVPEQKRRWLNVYSDRRSSWWTSRVLADEFCADGHLGVIEILIEDNNVVFCKFTSTVEEDSK